MPVARIPLVGSMNQRGVDTITALTAAKDQRFIGCMFDVVDNTITGKRTAYVFKRPGVQTSITLAANQGGFAICDQYGFTSMGECTAFATGSISAVTFFSGATQVGVTDVLNTTGGIFITRAIIGGEETFLMNVGGSSSYFVGTTGMAGGTTFTADTANGNSTLNNVSSITGLVIGQKLSGTGIASTARIQSIGATTLVMTANATATNSTVTITRERMSKIIATNFPVMVGPLAEMNGFVFGAESGTKKIWHSPLNSITSAWSASAFIPSDDVEGNLIGVSRNADYIIGHSVGGLQAFYNAGNPSGSVLSKVKGSTRRLGSLQAPGLAFTGTANAYKALDDTIAIAYGGIYLYSKGDLQKVSNDEIDRLLSNAPTANIAVDFFNFLGRQYVYVTGNPLTQAGMQWLYDVKNKIWNEAGFTNVMRISGHMGAAVQTSVLAGDGKLHLFPWTSVSQTPVFQDDGAAFTMTIQTSKIDHGTDKRKFVSAIRLIGDVQASGTATLTCSDDDYATQVTLGTFDMTSMVKKITRCGSYKGGRSYRITHSANTAFRAEAIEIEYSVGTS